MANITIRDLDDELRYGLAIIENGKYCDGLAEAIDRILRDDMAGRVLGFDSAAAEAYARIAARRRAACRPIAQADCQIAAIASARGATVATRDRSDFEGCGIELINP